MKKLSPAQQLIIDRMNEGWELKSSVGPDSSAWLSRVHAGKLETIGVSFASLNKLYKLGLVELARGYPINRWKMTAKP